MRRGDGSVWLSGLTPTRLEHGASAEAIAYSRVVDGARFELIGDDQHTVVLRNGRAHLSFPRGWRVVADAAGRPIAVVGLAAREVARRLETPSHTHDYAVGPNERIDLATGIRSARGFTPPRA